MTLQFEVDSLENLDETTAALYKEQDGKFVLDVDGHVKRDAGRIPKSRLDQEIQKRKAAEDSLASVADNLKETIPEKFRDLIPDLPPAQLITWIRKMNSSAIFDTKEPTPIDNRRPADKKPVDFENMSPQAIMARGYKK